MASHARATVLAPYTAPSSKTETKTALFRVSLETFKKRLKAPEAKKEKETYGEI